MLSKAVVVKTFPCLQNHRSASQNRLLMAFTGLSLFELGFDHMVFLAFKPAMEQEIPCTSRDDTEEPRSPAVIKADMK